jgi:UDP-N-acetyl-D-mannosaminuronic acid dehydrogenase
MLADRDVVLICVETPVDEHNIPRYEALRSALSQLGPVMKVGALVIVESTIAPGTMRDVVLPLLETSSGKRLNQGFYLGNCPERVMPGKLLANLHRVSRVVGGMTPETAQTMQVLYQHIVDAAIDLADCITAELVKTVENAYRDVQIAFANEVALICEQAGGDVWKVRGLVNKSPGRMMLMPGAGVGGHCIPKDPWLLAYSVNGSNLVLRLIPAARAVNQYMPVHMVELLEDGLKSAGKQVFGSHILVMGYAYLEDSDDTRNSPSQDLVTILEERGAKITIHDPYVPAYQGSLLEKARGCDAVVVMVRHKEYLALDLKSLAAVLDTPLMIDGRANFKKEEASQAGLRYWGVGISGEMI